VKPHTSFNLGNAAATVRTSPKPSASIPRPLSPRGSWSWRGNVIGGTLRVSDCPDNPRRKYAKKLNCNAGRQFAPTGLFCAGEGRRIGTAHPGRYVGSRVRDGRNCKQRRPTPDRSMGTASDGRGEGAERMNSHTPEQPASNSLPATPGVVCSDLLCECRDIIFQIQAGRKGHFGTWTGYEPQLECASVDRLATKLVEACSHNVRISDGGHET